MAISSDEQLDGLYQFRRALDALGTSSEHREAVEQDRTAAMELDQAEAAVHATLAQAAYTRDLAQAIRELAALPPRIPMDQLAALLTRAAGGR